MNSYYVYTAASISKVLYVGVTNSIERRAMEHRFKQSKFTAKYRVTRLVYVEETAEVTDAIAREKQLKGWRRSKKVTLIEQANPTWRDLSR